MFIQPQQSETSTKQGDHTKVSRIAALQQRLSWEVPIVNRTIRSS
ncbi:hypothetical protein SF83666_b64080 (plasmid) [Sinorhizobium fredii CCBAU 83666]|nr:hypothetical protein SF83666_b64080 [Sinorhizobium fredii CCBAU 83666]